MNMNGHVSPQQLLERLHWRYATKTFDPAQKISPEHWGALEEVLVLTPSSYGLQPWAFAVVDDPDKREKLLPASWGQRQVVDASRLVVFATRADLGERDVDAYIDRISEVRGVARESLVRFREVMVGDVLHGKDSTTRRSWTHRQVYIALGNLLNSAALLGIDACPMEGIDPAEYDAILGLDTRDLNTVAVCALGYRSESNSYASLPKVLFRKQEVVLHV